jgi:hypothetical protein
MIQSAREMVEIADRLHTLAVATPSGNRSVILSGKHLEAISAALRLAAQAAPGEPVGEPQNAQEPVAWNCVYPTYGHITLKKSEAYFAAENGAEVTALYAAPLPRLSDETVEVLKLIDAFMSHFGIGGHPSMNWQRSSCDDGIEMVHYAGDTIFFGDANHKDPDDVERFDLIVRLANSLPSIRAALAHSRRPEPSDDSPLAALLNSLDYHRPEINEGKMPDGLEASIKRARAALALFQTESKPPSVRGDYHDGERDA